MIIDITKNYHGYVSIRDYIVDKALKNNEPIIVNHSNKKMTISVSDLQTGKSLNSHVFYSKIHQGQEYTLVDFLFKAD